MDYFYAGPERAEKRIQYGQRGLIDTNNLALRIWAFDEDPEGLNAQIYYWKLPDSVKNHLNQLRIQHPAVWQLVAQTHAAKVEAFQELARNFDAPDSAAKEAAVDELHWQAVEAANQAFKLMEEQGLTPEEAIALCR